MIDAKKLYDCMESSSTLSPEKMLAEKYESIIRGNISSAHIQDYYDFYRLVQQHKNEICYDTLREEIKYYAEKHGSSAILTEWREILRNIREEPQLYTLWRNFTAEDSSNANVQFYEILDAVDGIAQELNF